MATSSSLGMEEVGKVMAEAWARGKVAAEVDGDAAVATSPSLLLSSGGAFALLESCVFPSDWCTTSTTNGVLPVSAFFLNKLRFTECPANAAAAGNEVNSKV